MKSREILRFCLEKGLLIDKEVLNLFDGLADVESAKIIIERISETTNQKIINRNTFYQHKDKVEDFFSSLSEDKTEKIKIKLGLSIEISKEIVSGNPRTLEKSESEKGTVRIESMNSTIGKKIEMSDFVKYFRNRFEDLRGFLQERPELNSLVSINKISGDKQGISVIGMISSKQVTKNKNIIFEVEDLTGKIKVLVSQTKKELYEKAENICMDAVVGFRCSGNREILFANEIVLPEAMISERKFSPVEECAIFISDIHVGSKLFLERSFLDFVEFLNGNVPGTEEEAMKIKYLFVVGDLVAGVGVYPNQERDLLIPDIEGQYLKFAELIGKIRKDLKIIIIPGNHDCVRLMEPQPLLDERYAWSLYQMENVILTTNPSTVNIGFRENFSGFDILMYHGFSFFYYVNNVPSLIMQDAANAPDKIMQYLLQNRHLAPSHGSAQYFPVERDSLLIRKAPDIFVSGHTHAAAVSYYNNILIISSSCWEDLTPIQEKFGSKPNFCKVPMFNLKTRQVKILDFEEEEHKEKIKQIMEAR
jgi:DNA polymerase II small subunit